VHQDTDAEMRDLLNHSYAFFAECVEEALDIGVKFPQTTQSTEYRVYSSHQRDKPVNDSFSQPNAFLTTALNAEPQPLRFATEKAAEFGTVPCQ